MTTTAQLEAAETLHRLATLIHASKGAGSLYGACYAVAKAACTDEADEDRIANVACNLQQALTAIDA